MKGVTLMLSRDVICSKCDGRVAVSVKYGNLNR